MISKVKFDQCENPLLCGEVRDIKGNRFMENEVMERLYEDLCESGDESDRLLWEILFEVDLNDKIYFKNLVYEFGSTIKVSEGFKRLVFVRLASLF